MPWPLIETTAATHLSRGVRQRIGKRRAARISVFDAVAALNSSANGNGESKSGEAVTPKFDPNRLQAAALEHVRYCVSDFCEPAERTPQESLRAILQADSLYASASA